MSVDTGKPVVSAGSSPTASSDSATGANVETFSSPRSRITITPRVERQRRLTSSTGIRITVPPSEISITW